MKTKEKLIIFTIIMMILLLVLPNTVNAALQSNGGTPKTDSMNNWLINIRKMQASGGTLGLTNTINGTNLKSDNTELDIHMEKNTEYGALVILSASSYGKPDKVNDGQTTTGNATGVLMKINNERVAAATQNAYQVANFKNALGRYKNIYTQNYANTTKKGDAILDWHGVTGCRWLLGDNENNPLLRATGGSIFSYFGNYNGNAKDTYPWASRAVIVVGSGI